MDIETVLQPTERKRRETIDLWMARNIAQFVVNTLTNEDSTFTDKLNVSEVGCRLASAMRTKGKDSDE